MNQIGAPIVLRDYLPRSDAWGHALGRAVQERLRALVEAQRARSVFAISLRGVSRTDASFPREAVVELAVRFRMRHGFYLTDVEDADVLENWDAAALRCRQPLLVWTTTPPRVLGPQPGEGTGGMFAHVLSVGVTTTGEAAHALDIKVPNASNKLKRLWEDGYILRRERVAQSGGIEFAYVRIG